MDPVNTTRGVPQPAGIWLQRTLSAVSWWVAVLAALFAVALVQVNQQGERAIQRSDRAFDRGDLDLATEFARQAATWYLPGASHVQRAHDRLSAIALGSESKGDSAQAIAAWSALRGVFHDTSHPWTVRGGRDQLANEHLMRLLGDRLPPGQVEQRAALVEAYRQPRSQPWLFTALTSFGAGLMLFAAGVHRAAVRSLGRSLPGLSRAAFALGLLLWTVAAAGV
jgi:hypothetical protein